MQNAGLGQQEKGSNEVDQLTCSTCQTLLIVPCSALSLLHEMKSDALATKWIRERESEDVPSVRMRSAARKETRGTMTNNQLLAIGNMLPRRSPCVSPCRAAAGDDG